jgi:hypothetical protein
MSQYPVVTVIRCEKFQCKTALNTLLEHRPGNHLAQSVFLNQILTSFFYLPQDLEIKQNVIAANKILICTTEMFIQMP